MISSRENYALNAPRVSCVHKERRHCHARYSVRAQAEISAKVVGFDLQRGPKVGRLLFNTREDLLGLP